MTLGSQQGLQKAGRFMLATEKGREAGGNGLSDQLSNFSVVGLLCVNYGSED